MSCHDLRIWWPARLSGVISPRACATALLRESNRTSGRTIAKAREAWAPTIGRPG